MEDRKFKDIRDSLVKSLLDCRRKICGKGIKSFDEYQFYLGRLDSLRHALRTIKDILSEESKLTPLEEYNDHITRESRKEHARQMY